MPRGEEAGGAAGGGPTGDFWTSLLLRCFLRFFSIFQTGGTQEDNPEETLTESPTGCALEEALRNDPMLSSVTPER